LRYALLGLLDRGILRALTLNFLMALVTLVAIFLIFTLFELLRYIDETGAKLSLLARYLFYLIPLAVASIAPVSMLIAVLITYALLTRRSEVVAWWAAGQSVYRLALPGLFLAATIGGGLWLLQEHLLPAANRRQEALRTQIRGGGTQAVTDIGRQWLALPTSRRIYAYRYDENSGTLEAPAVFEFDQEGVHLDRIITGRAGRWSQANELQLAAAQVLDLRPAQGGPRRLTGGPFELSEAAAPQAFKPVLNKPSELNARDLSAYINTLKLQRGADVRGYELGLARRRADPFAPLVMTCLGLPLALAFGRRAVLAALSVAVGVGLAFWGSLNGFQQLSQYKLLPPTMAAWAPLLIFLALGAYLFTRTRT
jgi:LPS export ABC transporter permease LptG